MKEFRSIIWTRIYSFKLRAPMKGNRQMQHSRKRKKKLAQVAETESKIIKIETV